MPPPRTGISGLGLMGGSFALALRRAAPETPLLGCDPDPVARQLALASGAFERVESGVAAIASVVDRLVLAAPVDAILADLGTVAQAQRIPALVMDLGSTKGEVCRRALELGLSHHFVGGHPMAGAATRGFAAADAGLFGGAAFALCAEPGVPALAAAQELVALVGARVVRIDAATHDRIVAITSHVPQLVSVALANAIADLARDHPEALELCGGGLRDLTRIATSPHDMWAPVLAENGPAIDLGVAAVTGHLARLAGARGGEASARAFERAAELRRRLRTTG